MGSDKNLTSAPLLAALNAEVIARLSALAKETDPSLLEQIFDAFLNEGAERITVIRESVSAGDAEAVHRAAHALKGASTSVGAHGLAGIAGQLEELGETGAVDGAMILIGQLEQEFARVRIEMCKLSETCKPG